MTNLASAMPVIEQAMASLPQATADATARGAPSDGTTFSLLLGEHLWTMSRPGVTGGDEEGNLPAAAAPAGSESAMPDPQAALQGLLAEIVNLAMDTAGGEESLVGRIAAKLQQAIDRLAGGQEPAVDSPVAATQAAADPRPATLLAGLKAMAAGLESVPAALSGTEATAADANQAASRPAPAQLEALVRQLLAGMLAELNGNRANGPLQGRILQEPDTIAGPSASPADDAIPARLNAPVPVSNPEPASGRVPESIARAEAPLLLDGRLSGNGNSPSAQWFNDQTASSEARATQVSDHTRSAPAATPAATAAAEPVSLETDLQLPGDEPLRLVVQAQRGSALDPVTRLDVLVTDPQGQADDMQVSMEITARQPERLISAQEMQRISVAMQRVLASTETETDPAVQTDRAVAMPVVAAEVLRRTAVPEADRQQAQPLTANRQVSPAENTDTGMPVGESSRGQVIPEADLPAGKPAGDAALLSSILGRRPAPQVSSPESGIGSLSQSTDTLMAGAPDSMPSINGGLLLPDHQQGITAVPDRLLQFSAPPAGGSISGYAMDEVQQQLLERVNDLRKAGNGMYNIKLDLYPKELGRMIVNIAVRGDNVAMQLAVLNQGQRDELQKQLNELRESLEEEGLAVVDMRILQLGGDERGTGRQTAR